MGIPTCTYIELISIASSNDDFKILLKGNLNQNDQVTANLSSNVNVAIEEDITIIETSLLINKYEFDDECNFVNIEDDRVHVDNTPPGATKVSKFQNEGELQNKLIQITIDESSESDSYIDVCEFETDTESCPSITAENINPRNENTTVNILQKITEQNAVTEVVQTCSSSKIAKKTRSRMTNLYGLYCSRCDETVGKIHGLRMTTCKNCNYRFMFYCKKCNKRYKNVMSLYQHLKTKRCESDQQDISKCNAHSGVKVDGYTYFCSTCNKTVPKIYRKPKTHCKSCKKKFHYSCSKCNGIYSSFCGIYVHVKRNNCSFPTSYPQKSSLLEESFARTSGISNNVPKAKLECEKCGDRCGKATDGADACKELKLFQCFACSFRCCKKSNLKCHIKTHDTATEIVDVCEGAKNDEKLQLIKNLNRSYQGMLTNALKIKKSVELHCSRCSITTEPQRLRFTYREQCSQCQDPMLYQCRNCKLQYSTWSAVYSHLRNECFVQARYTCDYCDYRAKQKGNLQSHMERKHLPRVCFGCDDVFPNFVALKTHQKTRECYGRGLKCNLCAFTCHFATRMKQHVHAEHKARYSSACPDCGKKYRNSESLRKHRHNACGRNRIFECEHCEYKVYKKCNLLKHLKNKHDGIWLG